MERKDVIEVMGPLGVVQTKNVIEDMRKNCESKMELMILNDKMLTFLKEQHTLKSYEQSKNEFDE